MAELAEFLASFALSQADKDAARKQALMMAGLGLLGAKKGREGEAMGRAGLLGMDAYQQGLTGAKQSKVDEYKLKQAWTQQQEADKQKAALNAARQAGVVPGTPNVPMGPPDPSSGQWGVQPGTPPGYDYLKYAQALAPIDPMAALGVEEKLRPKPQDSPYAKIDPKDYTPDSIAAYASSGNPAVLRRYEAPKEAKSPVGNVSPGDFTPASVQKFLTTGSYGDLVPIDKRPRVDVRVDNAPKLPPGYRWKDGLVGQAVEPLPGGPTDTSKLDASRADTKTATTNLVRSSIADAKKLAGKYTVGLVGVPLSKIPGTDATNLKRKVDNIVANIGFDRLQQMREESKTGGALGQVAVQELDMLQATLGSLKQDQSSKQFVQALDTIDEQYRRVLEAMQAMRSGTARPSDPLDIRGK